MNAGAATKTVRGNAVSLFVVVFYGEYMRVCLTGAYSHTFSILALKFSTFNLYVILMCISLACEWCSEIFPDRSSSRCMSIPVVSVSDGILAGIQLAALPAYVCS